MAVAAQRFHGERRQAQDGLAGLGLHRPDRQFLAPAVRPCRAAGQDVDDGEFLAEPHGAVVEVDVFPFQAAQFAVAGAGGGGEHGPGCKPWFGVACGGVQQQVDLFGEQRRGVFVRLPPSPRGSSILAYQRMQRLEHLPSLMAWPLTHRR